MIRYSLKCASTHTFDSWFRSSDAFETLRAAGQMTCPVCGTADVEKTMMAPAVRPGRSNLAQTLAEPGRAAASGALSNPQSAIEQAFAAMRKQVEDTSEYVGLNFAAEARQMHDGEKPARAIYGEAKPDEARQLIEDGVPVAPLPFMPRRKTN